MIDMKQIKENVSSKIKGNSQFEQEQAIVPTSRGPLEQRQDPQQAKSASIGASITIKGDVTGDENLVIHGTVEGKIKVQSHNVTISKTGKVKADIEAKQIIIDGQLQGDMHGDEKVVIRESGNVTGNIIAPRVNLEDGAKFKGSIEMEPESGKLVKPSTGELHSA